MRNTRIELELGGKVRPLLFNHSFFEDLTADGTTLSDLDDMNLYRPWRFIPTLAVSALKAGADFENKKDKFDYDQVSQWLTAIEDPMILNQIPECYKAALGFIYHANMGKDVFAEAASKAAENVPKNL